jgi:hypothetical protein
MLRCSSVMLCILIIQDIFLAIRGLRVLVMENPPYVCTDWSPCQPAYAGHDLLENSTLKNVTLKKSTPAELLPGNANSHVILMDTQA